MLENEERLEKLKQYLKYIVLVIPLVVVFFLIKGCGNKYSKLEDKVEAKALSYIKENNILVTTERFIELVDLGEFEGTETCSKSSGVIVRTINGKLEAQAYLECGDYKTEAVDNKEKYMTLNGGDVLVLNKGEVFNDPGYTLKKDGRVEVVGNVNQTPGIYTLRYHFYDGNELKDTLIRKVIVSKSDKTSTISGITSTTNPTIILDGDIDITLSVGEEYIEPGYRAVDYKDGKISRQVKVTPSYVDTSKEGTIIILYSVTNSNGKIDIKQRNVNVIRNKSNIEMVLTAEDDEIAAKNNITVKTYGSGLNNIILPDGSKRYSTGNTVEASYEVTSNGSYQFIAVDKYGNKYPKTISINNIDDIPPTGSCKAVVSYKGTEVEVTASDNKGIGGYKYIIDDTATDYKTQNVYNVATKAKKAQAVVKDIVGNEKTIDCELEEKTIVSGTGCNSNITVNVKTCFGDKMVRNNIPLEEYLMGVLYGEEDPAPGDSMEYVKAFVIFARTYTLRRGKYTDESTPLSLRTCSSDQNWCDYEKGCYREQTDEMFNQCIEYSLRSKEYSKSGKDPYYDAKTCADRVTTFPGSKPGLTNRTYYVNNSGWPSNYASSAMGTANTPRWKGPSNSKSLAILRQAIEETEGMVIKTSDGKLASVGYYMCDYYERESTMCPNKAEELGAQGKTMEEIILAYTKAYKDISIECYK